MNRLVRIIRNQPFASWLTWLSLGLGLFFLGILALNPSALYSFRTTGTNGLSILTVIGAFLIIGLNGFVILHSWLNLSREQFIFRNAVRSAAFHAILGIIIGGLIVAPYGLLDVRNLILSAFLFFAVTSVSFGTWTYWRFHDLSRASRRLTRGARADYRNILGFETSFDQLDERISICRDCLSLVGNSDQSCWRCDSNLDVQAERLVASVNPLKRLRPY